MKPSIPVLSFVLVCAAGSIAACNLALGLDELKDQIDSRTPETGAADGGDAAVDAAPNCADYCTSILKRCQAPSAQYLDQPTCLAICATFPMGSSAQSANTLLCRLANLKADAGCVSAGPYAPTCGGEAENFCRLYNVACEAGGGYDPDCPGTFGAIAPGDGGFLPENNGSTRTCREYNLEAAFQKGNGDFCLEASKTSSPLFCR